MKIQKFLDYLKKNKYTVIFLIAAIVVILFLIYLKISSKLSTISNIKNISTFSIPEDVRAILEKYNLSIKELGEKRLVITDPQNCTMYIYSAPLRLVIVDVTIIKEFNLSVMEEDTDDKYIYILLHHRLSNRSFH